MRVSLKLFTFQIEFSSTIGSSSSRRPLFLELGQGNNYHSDTLVRPIRICYIYIGVMNVKHGLVEWTLLNIYYIMQLLCWK